MRSPLVTIAFTLNGRAVEVRADPARRLADVLREDLGLTGTKIGCNAGDCGACTVLMDNAQVCACLIPFGRVAGRCITTVEGLAEQGGALSALQAAFLRHGAAQCGICTPGMLTAASDLLARTPHPTEAEVMDALGGVLCRCTGYRKIIEAVLDASGPAASPQPARLRRDEGKKEPSVGTRLAKVDGVAKLIGAEKFGADALPNEPFLTLRAVRSPHAHARFTLGDLTSLYAAHPGLVRVLTAADIPGRNLYGIYPTGKDQPVLAEGYVRHRGEPVCALVGDADTLAAIRDEDVPITWHVLPPVTFDTAADGPDLHAHAPGNVLCRGRVARGDVAAGFAAAAAHAAIAVRTSQPLVCVAAWLLRRPVRMVYTRPESMGATTKRHPAAIHAEAAADAAGRLLAFRFRGDFDTGAYASWGPTVANRVPVHAMGPYAVPNVLCTTAAIHTTAPPSGAFRGFGVPQAAIAGEALMDMLAERLGLDPWEIRRRNALGVGSVTATGQQLGPGAALPECLDAIRPHWQALRAAAAAFNRTAGGPLRRGAGLACMWYGIGNTSLSNPSEMVMGLRRDGRAVLFSGAVDIGQGSNTIMVQIAADALGVPPDGVELVTGDTDRTRDAGKTSASRQTFVSGNAAKRAGEALRSEILRRCNAGAEAKITLTEGRVIVTDGGVATTLDLAALAADAEGLVLRGEGRFDPPTTELDANGQGIPYATYAFAAQAALVEVDTALGTVRVVRIVAAHDVGRAINPTLVEGQIHGGIAQGLGLALMEEFMPGRTENLHDYLIPTIGDVPPIDVILIEQPDSLGPYGAKGVGEPALIATAPAILNAIAHATGARITHVPATPDRVLAALPR
jgi:aldehyde oxidoreductase